MREAYNGSKFIDHSQFYQTISIKAKINQKSTLGKKVFKINFPEATVLN